MPSTRQRTTFRKRNLHNGALLAVSQAAKFVNIPLAQDVVRHLKHVAVALQPSVLQAPKTNDSNAKDLEKHIIGLADVLNTAIRNLDGAAGVHTDTLLVELRQLHNYLSDTHTKLQAVQTSSYTTKLASQAEIRSSIFELKEELSRTITDLTLRLLVVVLSSSAQSQVMMVHRLESATRSHNALIRDHNGLTTKHEALVRNSQRRQRISDKRIRGLERNCQSLTQQVNAVLRMRQTDEQRIGYLVLLNRGTQFCRGFSVEDFCGVYEGNIATHLAGIGAFK